MTNTTLSNMVGVAATAVVIGYSGFGEPALQNNFLYNGSESAQLYQGQYDYYSLNKNNSISITEQIETLQKFASSILSNIKDIDPEYTKLVDDKFWDLV